MAVHRMVIAFLVFVSAASAQELRIQPPNTPLGVIDTVILAGNKKTRDYVILNEMTLKRGSVATPELIEYDRNRIYSLGLFTRVDIFFDELEGKQFLYVDVNERWYLIPIPIFGFREGDPKKAYYGAGFLHNNFQGRNQKLYFTGTFGFDPAVSFSFTEPLIDRENNLFFSAGLSTSRTRNRSRVESDITGDFDERHYDINATIGKRLTMFQNVGLNAGFHVVNISDFRPGRTVSLSGRDKFIYCTLSYSFDTRDLKEYPMRGQLHSFSVTRYGLGESPVDFTRFSVDLRRFFPLPGEFALATRVSGTMVAGGLVPTYARAYYGYGEKIRGHFNTVYEGENLAGASVELRYPLLKARTIVFTAIPLPEEFAVWRFGVSLALFADAGTAWFRGQKLQFSSFASGYGGGIHFLLPYGYVARTEYAWNEYFKGQFILDLRGSI